MTRVYVDKEGLTQSKGMRDGNDVSLLACAAYPKEMKLRQFPRTKKRIPAG